VEGGVSDPALAAIWLAVLGAGLGACVVVRALGLASTYVRDLLHVGAGVWVLGWPYWHGGVIPIAIVVAVAVAIALVPRVARAIPLAARFERSVSGGDERWGGLVLYTLSYAALTALAFTTSTWAAAAGLLALSLGDGIGGAVGRRFGRHHYRAPGGKTKSLEGSLVVALGALAGALIAARITAHPISVATAIGLGAIAAAVEAGSPRGTDNALVPAAVWLAASLAA
jgi:phytol kinase